MQSRNKVNEPAVNFILVLARTARLALMSGCFCHWCPRGAWLVRSVPTSREKADVRLPGQTPVISDTPEPELSAPGKIVSIGPDRASQNGSESPLVKLVHHVATTSPSWDPPAAWLFLQGFLLTTRPFSSHPNRTNSSEPTVEVCDSPSCQQKCKQRRVSFLEICL